MATNILIFINLYFYIQSYLLSPSHGPWGLSETPNLPFFVDADSTRSFYLFLVYDLDPCTVTLVLHDRGIKRLFHKGVISFIQAMGFPWIFWHVQICSAIPVFCTTTDVSWHMHMIRHRALQVSKSGSWNRVVSCVMLPQAQRVVLFQVSLQKVVQDFWLPVLHWLHSTALGARDQILKYFSRINRRDGLDVTLYCFHWSCRLICSLQVIPVKLEGEQDLWELCGTLEYYVKIRF